MPALMAPQTDPPEALNDVPRSAFRFRTPNEFQFAKVAADADIFPFEMQARSGDAIRHWYWGRIIHDMAGMQLSKSSVTVDYSHWDEVIGYADKFTADDNGLQASGALVSIKPDDRAREVYLKGKAGVPYEASIDWEGPDVELEFVPEGVSTEVNGQQFAGPGYVVRKWPLRAIAVCRYGADADTRTQFNKEQGDDEKVSVCVFSRSAGDPDVTKEAPKAATEPAAKTADTQTAPTEARQLTEQPVTEPAKTPPAGGITVDQIKQFSDEFGAELGTQYLTSGLSLDAARYQFAQHKAATAEAEAKTLREQLAAKDKTITEATEKLKQFGADLGQATPIETAPEKPGENDPRLKQFTNVAGENRAKFALAIKMPGKRETAQA